MKGTRIWLCLALIGILVFSGLPKAAVAQPAPWFSQSAAQKYVDDLITDYYTDVQFGQSHQPNFTVDSSNFQLWHGIGYDFNVTVIRFNSTAVGIVGFVFQPIASNYPLVYVDNNDTVQEYFQTPPIATGGQTYAFSPAIIGNTVYGTAYFYVGSNFPQFGRPVVPLIWVTNSAWVLNDSSGQNAKNAGDAIYEEDIHFTNETAVSSELSRLSSQSGKTASASSSTVATATSTTTIQKTPPPPWYDILWGSVVFWVFVVIAGGVAIVSFYWEAKDRLKNRGQSGKTSEAQTKGKKGKGER